MFNKDIFKGIIIGIAATLLLTTTSLAASLTKQLSVTYNNIKISIDDALFIPKDAKGTVVEPFMYNGTVYLPARAIANAFGKDVTYDSKVATVYIGSHSGRVSFLGSLGYARKNGTINFDNWPDLSSFKVAGKEYSKGLGIQKEASPCFIVYSLSKKYKTLTGLFGTDDKNGENANVGNQMIITGDGKTLYKTQMLYPGEKPEVININVTGIDELEITFETTAASGVSYADFVNAKLQE